MRKMKMRITRMMTMKTTTHMRTTMVLRMTTLGRKTMTTKRPKNTT